MSEKILELIKKLRKLKNSEAEIYKRINVSLDILSDFLDYEIEINLENDNVTASIPFTVNIEKDGGIDEVIHEDVKVKSVYMHIERNLFSINIVYDIEIKKLSTWLILEKDPLLLDVYKFTRFFELNKKLIDKIIEKIEEREKKSKEKIEEMKKKVSKLLTVLKLVGA